MDAVKRAFRKGMIQLWSGAIADIPSGWALCDGTNGTPNLQNNFVVGAGDSYVVDATGGDVSHYHSMGNDTHTHVLSVGAAVAAGGDFASVTTPPSPAGSSDAADNRPPYHALAYIMKL